MQESKNESNRKNFDHWKILLFTFYLIYKDFMWLFNFVSLDYLLESVTIRTVLFHLMNKISRFN